MKKFTIFSMLLLFIYSCSIMSNSNKKTTAETKKMAPEKIIIYKLPDFSDYFQAVQCEEIKNMNDAEIITITDKKEIDDFYKTFNNETYYTVDSNFHEIDSRMLIEFIFSDDIVKQICWSETKQIQMDGRIYRYSKEVENFLLSKKIISVIIFD